MQIQGAASQARQSGLSRWAWLFWLGGAGLFAFWLTPYGNPTSPVDLQPYGTLVTGDIPTSTVTLHWTQGGIVRSLRGPSPGRGRRFVVCFHQDSVAHDCAAGTGIVARVEAEAHTITRRELPSGDRLDRLQSWLSPRYDYDFPVSLPQAALDVGLGWTVGACSTAADTSCTFAAEQALALTARDLAVQRIDDDVQYDNASRATGVAINLDMRNDGRTSNEPMHLETRVWEILRVGNSDDPLIDPAGAPADHVVITRRGEELAISAFDPARDEVLGIHPPNGVRRVLSRDVPDVPPPKAAGSPLLPGSCNAPGAIGPDPCNGVTGNFAACEPEPCVVARPGHATLYAVYAEVNPGRVPWDFDPSDNASSKNGVYVP
jgi:hypothetical protein